MKRCKTPVMMVSVLVMLGLCAGSLAAEPAATTQPAGEACEKALETVLPQLHFDEMELASVVEYFRVETNANILVNWVALENVGVDRDTPVTIQLDDVTFRRALKAVLSTVGGVVPLGFAVIDDAIWISTEDDLATRTFTKVHDVRDVFDGDPPQEQVVELMDCIRTTIAPDTWIVNGGLLGSLRCLGATTVVVAQTYDNHRAVEALLAKLRGTTIRVQPSAAAQARQAEPRLKLVGNMKDLCYDPQAMGIVAIGGLHTEAGLEPAELIDLLNGMLDGSGGPGVPVVKSLGMRNAIRLTLKDLYVEMGDTAKALEQLERIIEQNDHAMR